MTDLAKKFSGFFAVALAGLVVDIGIGWSLNHWFGVPLTLAAAIGFVTAAGFNYLVNLKLTFADRGLSASGRGFAAYLLSVGAGLAVRLGILAFLQWALPENLQFSLAMLIVAAGVSLLVNFALANKWAFAPNRADN